MVVKTANIIKDNINKDSISRGSSIYTFLCLTIITQDIYTLNSSIKLTW